MSAFLETIKKIQQGSFIRTSVILEAKEMKKNCQKKITLQVSDIIRIFVRFNRNSDLNLFLVMNMRAFKKFSKESQRTRKIRKD